MCTVSSALRRVASLTLTQFGNTCYCNSVLQVLFFTLPFREALPTWDRTKEPRNLLEALCTPPFTSSTLLLPFNNSSAAQLFNEMLNRPAGVSSTIPRNFISRLSSESGGGFFVLALNFANIRRDLLEPAAAGCTRATELSIELLGSRI
jgi:hypothetical protein